MPRPPRGLAAIVVVGVLLALSGCVRLRTDVLIRSDDQVTVSVDLGTLRQYANPAAEPCQADAGLLPTTATRRPYDDGTYVGCVITATGPAAALGRGLSVVHADGHYTFRFTGADPNSGGPIDPGTLTDFQVRVTFPGKVVSANGSGVIDGTRVTWSDATALADGELVAVGEDGDGWHTVLPWLVGAVVVLLVLVVGLGIYLKVRPRPTPALRVLPPRTLVLPPAVPPPAEPLIAATRIDPGPQD